MSKLTPMLKQYHKIKQQHPDAMVLFRLGDFYELFGDDAKEASKILGITLTARYKGHPSEIAMCGAPHHAIENYIVKLTKAGKKVAICEQITPAGFGLVERKVVRIITPGTTISSSILEAKNNNYVMAIEKKGDMFGFALADAGTGEFKANQTVDSDTLKSLIFRLHPSEIILKPELFTEIQELVIEISDIVIHHHEPPIGFDPYDKLIKHFQVHTLDGFGLEQMTQAIDSAGLLLDYLLDTQKTELAHINRIGLYHFGEYMALDETTIRNLELLFTIYDQSQQGSLLSIIDDTQTAMGGRRLRYWLLHPLLNSKKINLRLKVVKFLMTFSDTDTLRDQLNQVADIERLLGKVGLERANARDLLSLKESLIQSREIKSVLPDNTTLMLKKIKARLHNHQNIIDLLEKSIIAEPPLEITEAGIINDGYNEELDELRTLSRHGKDWLKNLVTKEIERTGISSLKIKYNRVFGYYIEISKSNLANVPEDYIRKQTLVNAERFITPELKEFEEKILNAEEKMKILEHKLFLEIRNQVALQIPAIQKTASAVAVLDVLANFATIAQKNNYSKPLLNDSGKIEIRQGRHPVIEKMLDDKPYIPNDTFLDDTSQQIVLLTGPNMGGKSSYLRQVALIGLMAQIGCFVPAQSANLAIIDRIFTRVGAADNLARGQSTFMVEMQEAASILNNATNRSLIILDELGRGTSTYDGLSIAWAVLEYIHDKIGAKTLFATHYHELIDVVTKLKKASNFSMAVTEHEGQIIFLYQVKAGGTPDSYGIEVAHLAGLPRQVLDRSKDILKSLEDTHSGQLRLVAPTIARDQKRTPDDNSQKIIDQLLHLKTDEMTPLEALKQLSEMVKKLNSKS